MPPSRSQKFLSWLTGRASALRDLSGDRRKHTIAAVTLGGKIISLAGNEPDRSDPLQKFFNGGQEIKIYGHAEILAIKRAHKLLTPSEFSRASLWVARSKGRPAHSGLARPCSGCWGAIEAFNIRKVLWTQ